METQRTKPDIRLDLTGFSIRSRKQAVQFLLEGSQECRRNEKTDADAAPLGKMLLALAVLLKAHIPDEAPTPAGIGSLN